MKLAIFCRAIDFEESEEAFFHVIPDNFKQKTIRKNEDGKFEEISAINMHGMLAVVMNLVTLFFAKYEELTSQLEAYQKQEKNIRQ